MGKAHISSSSFFFFFIEFTVILVLIVWCVDGYKNYTVGGDLGWYDPLQNPKLDYQKWASHINFTLGDFLIFNTDNNHSVTQTYNFTTYKLCDYSDALDNDTVEWLPADPSATAPLPVSVAVPLIKVGMTYFFSGDYDGDQCLNGQRVKVNVTYGQGLPPSLRSPSDDSPAPISPDSGDDDSVPDTLVPSNFDDPKDVSDDGAQPSISVSLLSSPFSRVFGVQLHGFLVVLGFLISF